MGGGLGLGGGGGKGGGEGGQGERAPAGQQSAGLLRHVTNTGPVGGGETRLRVVPQGRSTRRLMLVTVNDTCWAVSWPFDWGTENW